MLGSLTQPHIWTANLLVIGLVQGLIVSLIAMRPRRPSAIARVLGAHRSTVTHQLRQLEEAGLIMSRRTRHDGRGVFAGLPEPF